MGQTQMSFYHPEDYVYSDVPKKYKKNIENILVNLEKNKKKNTWEKKYQVRNQYEIDTLLKYCKHNNLQLILINTNIKCKNISCSSRYMFDNLKYTSVKYVQIKKRKPSLLRALFILWMFVGLIFLLKKMH